MLLNGMFENEHGEFNLTLEIEKFGKKYLVKETDYYEEEEENYYLSQELWGQALILANAAEFMKNWATLELKFTEYVSGPGPYEVLVEVKKEGNNVYQIMVTDRELPNGGYWLETNLTGVLVEMVTLLKDPASQVLKSSRTLVK